MKRDALLTSDKQSSALQEAECTSVANGKAYGICSCSREEREDTPKCFVEQTNPEQLSITCQDGYSLEVRPLLIGKTRGGIFGEERNERNGQFCALCKVGVERHCRNLRAFQRLSKSPMGSKQDLPTRKECTAAGSKLQVHVRRSFRREMCEEQAGYACLGRGSLDILWGECVTDKLKQLLFLSVASCPNASSNNSVKRAD